MPVINADLTTTIDLTQTKVLRENRGICFQGPVKVGKFEIDIERAAEMLQDPNPNGRPNSDVVRPWCNGKAVTARNPHRFIIDFRDIPRAEAALYEGPFGHVERHVYTFRKNNRDRQRRENWWLLGRSGTDLRTATAGLHRLAATPRVAKHRLFVWLPWCSPLPSASALDAAQSSRLETRPRYTPTSVFDTFAFPVPTDEQREAIASATRELHAARTRWLDPPEWSQLQTLTFPARIDGPWGRVVVAPNEEGVGTATYSRTVPVDEAAEKALKKRTLTKLYNEAPAWLRDLHHALDIAVFAAYGLPRDASEQAILAHLLALNLERFRERAVGQPGS